MVFATNVHTQLFLKKLQNYEDRIEDNYFCACVYISSCPWPFEPDESFFEACLNEFKRIVKEGLPSDIREYISN